MGRVGVDARLSGRGGIGYVVGGRGCGGGDGSAVGDGC